MQILKRARGRNDGEIVSPFVKEKDLRDEVNRRTSKAGYTTRYGEPPYRTRIMDNGFGESKLNVWSRDEQGNLIDD